MNIRNNIPNFITSLNLLAGCISIICLGIQKPDWAGLMIFAAALFDFLDGMAARLLNARSAIGADLDSLSDVVSFGVAPALLMFSLINMSCNIHGYSGTASLAMSSAALIIVILAAWRLARFNNDSRQSEHFIGLPVPANALFFAAFPLIMSYNFQFLPVSVVKVLFNPAFLTISCLVLSSFMVSSVHLFSLKFKNLNWSQNKVQYSFLILSVLLVSLLLWASIPLIILLYIVISILFWKPPVKEIY